MAALAIASHYPEDNEACSINEKINLI